jgi:hypothetical protein
MARPPLIIFFFDNVFPNLSRFWMLCQLVRTAPRVCSATLLKPMLFCMEGHLGSMASSQGCHRFRFLSLHLGGEAASARADLSMCRTVTLSRGGGARRGHTMEVSWAHQYIPLLRQTNVALGTNVCVCFSVRATVPVSGFGVPCVIFEDVGSG